MSFKDINSSMKEKQPLLRLINSYFKNVLDSQNLVEIGKNMQYYNPQKSQIIPRYKIKVL